MSFYAYARDFSAPTGDVALAAGVWTGGAPALQQVLFRLRTRRGSCLLDTTLGVDWNRLDKAGANAAATCVALVREGLAPLVANGTIAALSVNADSPITGAVFFEVTFTDPRTPGARQTTGRLSA